jgi:hypothetical protein
VFSFEPRCQGLCGSVEVDLHIRGHREVLVFGHLQVRDPRSASAAGRGEFTSMPTQCRHHHRGVFAGHLDQHGKA